MKQPIPAQQSGIRNHNLQRVLRHIVSEGPSSRQEIATNLSLSLPTVLNSLKALEDAGLVLISGQSNSTGGRKASVYSANRDAVYSLGVDVTKNHINLVLVGLTGEAIANQRISCAFQNSGDYFVNLNQLIRDFANSEAGQFERIMFCGVSLPGILNSTKNVLTYSYVLNLHDYDCNIFSKAISDWNCTFENDANAAGLAEMKRRKNHSSSLVYLSLSNSVGGSFFSDGQLVLGKSRRCGEIGHMRIVPEGALCSCGQRGCLDSYCSALQLSNSTNGNLELFFEKLSADEPFSRSVWNRYLDHLLSAIISLRMIYDCDIVLGGYVGALAKPFINEIRAKLEPLDPFHASADYLSCCEYALNASAYGASLIPLENYINSISFESLTCPSECIKNVST